jgi:hypothetical protein
MNNSVLSIRKRTSSFFCSLPLGTYNTAEILEL